MNILIIGSEGSMGSRYKAIFKYLGKSFTCVDVNDSEDKALAFAQDADGIVIASPTDTHSAYIHMLSPSVEVPILCEKPVCKDINELRDVLDICRSNGTKLSMMMQYEFLDYSLMLKINGNSHYDYFKTGNDGLIWDCFQTIALARGPVVVRNESPIWDVQLNGRKLNLSDMDNAYISYVAAWLEGGTSDLTKILEMHLKVHRYEITYG